MRPVSCADYAVKEASPMKKIEKPVVQNLRVSDRRRGDALRAPRFDQQPACRFCGEDCDGLH